MNQRALACAASIVLAIGLAACSTNRTRTAADSMTTHTTGVAPRAQEVTPNLKPPTGADKAPDPLSQDLQSVNRYVEAQGLIGDVFFDFDKYELKPEARERLAKDAQWLNAHPEFTATVEGHCDERGTAEYNLALGDRRANSARAYLTALGVNGSHLRTVSYGKERPFCNERSESCWAQNRRDHFMITGRVSG